MKISEMPVSERPREKLMKYGREALSTAELIAILIGNGTKGKSALEIAMKLLFQSGGNLCEIAYKTPEELMADEGIGRATACRIVAASEIGRRMASTLQEGKISVRDAGDVVSAYMEKMRYYRKEYLISLLFNSRGEMIYEDTVSIGDLCSSVSHPREVFLEAVRRSAAAVILIHNHPSGDPSPSEGDIQTTERLISVGELMGIPVIDHIIFGDGRYVSMKEAGYFK